LYLREATRIENMDAAQRLHHAALAAATGFGGDTAQLEREIKRLES